MISTLESRPPLADAATIPVDDIDVARPELFQADAMWPYFDRLRRDDPVHYCADSAYGPYWSVTKFQDIVQVETHHKIFSSESTLGGITIRDQEDDFPLPMFIAMDPPKHDVQRKTVSPIFAPESLSRLEETIRQRMEKILDNLPVGETFDWVDRVSIELTTQMLATLFDFPFDERRKLTRWSDVATAIPGSGICETEDQRKEELRDCAASFMDLWNARVNADPRNDLISMLAHGDATRNMGPQEFLGNLILLIVGGNDTTRNSISGGVLALNQAPNEYQKLRDNPDLIPNMVSEIIRWQTPLAHMRRTAVANGDIGGKPIKKGDKVVLWYVSGNRDEEEIPQANEFMIDRPRVRHHLSFGFGIHRCLGNRLAEMQLRIVWEEVLKRFRMVEVMGESERTFSVFVKGYTKLPVRLHPW